MFKSQIINNDGTFIIILTSVFELAMFNLIFTTKQILWDLKNIRLN